MLGGVLYPGFWNPVLRSTSWFLASCCRRETNWHFQGLGHSHRLRCFTSLARLSPRSLEYYSAGHMYIFAAHRTPFLFECLDGISYVGLQVAYNRHRYCVRSVANTILTFTSSAASDRSSCDFISVTGGRRYHQGPKTGQSY